MTEHESSDRATIGQAGVVAIASVTFSLIAFPIAFNLGAYQAVLYPDIFRAVVASFVLLCVNLRYPTYTRTRVWFTRVWLASPTIWFATATLALGSTDAAMERPVFVVWLVVTIAVSVPLTLKLLIDMFAPEIGRGDRRQHALWVAAIVGTVAVMGYLVGTFNDRIMTCGDFSLAGASQPSDCTP
jgi:hypothetical protein